MYDGHDRQGQQGARTSPCSATTTKVTGLVTATGEVKSGQQIVVVGAPLGLEDTVTTGVVSAVRKTRTPSRR